MAASAYEPEASGAGAGGLFAGLGRYHLLVFIGCWLGGVFDGMDSTLMSVVLPVAVSDLIGTTDKALVSQTGAWIMSAFLVGWMLGGILFGWVGDKLGRVRSMIFSILLYALFTGLSGFAQTWEQLAVCRFLTGLGIGGELVSIATFLTEVWPHRSRTIAVGTLITSYQAGVFLAGTIDHALGNWRHDFFIGALPALLVIFLRFFLKESDKWMADRESQIKQGETAAPLKALFAGHYGKRLFIGAAAFAGLLVGYWASLSWIPAWISDLLGKNAVGDERSIATMYQGVAAIVGCTVSGFLCDGWGRRITLAFGFGGCLAASALLFLTNSVFTPIIYWESAFLGFFIGLAQASMYIYLPELFPTRVRATATGFCLNTGRLLTAVAVLFIGAVVMMLGGYAQAAFAFSLAYLVSFFAALGGVETKGQALPQ